MKISDVKKILEFARANRDAIGDRGKEALGMLDGKSPGEIAEAFGDGASDDQKIHVAALLRKFKSAMDSDILKSSQKWTDSLMRGEIPSAVKVTASVAMQSSGDLVAHMFLVSPSGEPICAIPLSDGSVDQLILRLYDLRESMARHRPKYVS